MGLMGSWKNWSQKQWDKWGKKLQPLYTRIDDWDCPWLTNVCKNFWSILDKETQKKIYDFVMVLITKYGEDFAKKLVEEVLKKLGLDLNK